MKTKLESALKDKLVAYEGFLKKILADLYVIRSRNSHMTGYGMGARDAYDIIMRKILEFQAQLKQMDDERA